MSDPRVSVVMPVRDAERFLPASLDSLLAQTLTNFEIVAVDDGSTDRSAAILDEYALRDARLRVLHCDAQGLTRALDVGCRASRAAYIARMDADDIAVPARLELQVRFLDDHPEVGVAGSGFVFMDERGRLLGAVRYPSDDAQIRRELERYNCIAHPTVVMRRDAYEEAGGYRLPNAEDYDLWLRIGDRRQLANLRQTLLHYRHHPSQYSVSALADQAAGALVARAAARSRARGEPDPLGADPPPAREALALLGVPEGELEASVVEQYLRWAAVFAETGNPPGARALLQRAVEAGGGRREVAARWRFERAKTSLVAGRRARAAGLLAGALVRDPSLVGVLVASARGRTH